MNIVVAIKQVPDLQQIRIRNREPVLDGVPQTLGMIDKNALEAGLQLKEAFGGQLIVVMAGNEEVSETVKEALAVGADEAYIVADNAINQIDGAQSALIIAELIKKIPEVGLLLCGEGSGDNYSGQVGSRVAELLGWPQVGYASHMEINGEELKVLRSLEEVEEWVSMPLPGVVSVLSDINEPRLPSVTQVLKAGKKPKRVYTIEELGLSIDNQVVVTKSNLAPENKRRQQALKTIDELMQVLRSAGLLRG